MCNLYRLEKGPDAIRKLFEAVQIPLSFPEGIPNFEPRDVRITEQAPIVCASEGRAGAARLVERRWSWPGPAGKPVYNLRSEGREFPMGRCLVLADGFYEYTAPADPKQKRKDRWLFTPSDGEPFAIAGFVRDTPGIGEAFSLLTTSPSPDVAPYHSRQIVVLRRADWGRWLDSAAPVGDLLQPLAAGDLKVEAA
jgi:putative SOS response-associated peptidase YedK